MVIINYKFLAGLGFMLWIHMGLSAQEAVWSLDRCIDYALSQNIDIKQSGLNVEQAELNYQQSRNNRLPSVNASVSYNLGWEKTYVAASEEYSPYEGASGMNYGVNTSVNVFNGFKLRNQIEKSALEWETGKYTSERIKESVELSILNAYLNILYSLEEVSNLEEQVSASREQLALAEERMNLGIISRSDYLQIKSGLASEELNLVTAQSNLRIARVNLMQLMELPVSNDFDVLVPDIGAILNLDTSYEASSIYQEALMIKPQIKEAEFRVKSVMLEEDIARADLMPGISMSAGLNTGWGSSFQEISYTSQLGNRLAPSVGVNLSVPIFQKNQVMTNIKTAQISLGQAQLEEINTRNTLRKEIEQAVTDYTTARVRYLSSVEQFGAARESYLVAAEKFDLGIINSIDLVLIKNDMILAESTLLQTKFSLLFSQEILDFYRGNPISLTN
ncbi:MAG: TolC family protein [Bacteroidales bacterium]|nr:TolC family protein [Bacteroidales bacterium]